MQNMSKIFKGILLAGAVLLMIVLLTNFKMLMEITSFKSELGEKIYRQRDQVNNEVRNISREVSHTLNKIEEQKLWVRDTSVEVIGLSEDKTADVLVSFALNSLNAGETLELIVYQSKGKNENNIVKRIPVTNEKMRQTVELNLDLKANYIVDIVGNADGVYRSATIGESDIYDRLLDRFDTDIEVEHDEEATRLSISIDNDRHPFYNYMTSVSYMDEEGALESGEHNDIRSVKCLNIEAIQIDFIQDGKTIYTESLSDEWSQEIDTDAMASYYLDKNIGEVKMDYDLIAEITVIDSLGITYTWLENPRVDSYSR